MRLRGRVVLVAALAVAVLATLAAPALGRVVLQQGIAGVSLQMTTDQVRNVLGKPRSVKSGHNTFGRYMDYRYPKLTVRFQGLTTVTAIFSSRRTERTRGGIGVGSTKAQVKAKIGSVHCRTALLANFCFVGVLKPGRRVTIFHFNDANRVNRVEVGLVVD